MQHLPEAMGEHIFDEAASLAREPEPGM